MDEAVTGIFLIILCIFYFIPTFTAMTRKHININSIIILNLFLGWTLLGWIGALIWSVSALKDAEESF